MFRKGLALGVLLLALSAGCLGPLSGDSGKRCPVCGMPTDVYDGPKGKVAFQDGEVFRFCSTADMFQVLVQPGFNAEDVESVQVQDVAETGWKSPEGGWVEAESAHYVVGSDRTGAMGGTLVSFADRREAETFAEEHGGEVLSYDEIDGETVRRYTRFR